MHVTGFVEILGYRVDQGLQTTAPGQIRPTKPCHPAAKTFWQ